MTRRPGGRWGAGARRAAPREDGRRSSGAIAIRRGAGARRGSPVAAAWVAVGAIAAALALFACGPANDGRGGVDPATLAPELRDDYAVFALRCSKCHALSRPLESGIDNDGAWVRYVARMRLQPASGISARDAEAILRFLHVLVERQRAAKRSAESPRDVAPRDVGEPSRTGEPAKDGAERAK